MPCSLQCSLLRGRSSCARAGGLLSHEARQQRWLEAGESLLALWERGGLQHRALPACADDRWWGCDFTEVAADCPPEEGPWGWRSRNSCEPAFLLGSPGGGGARELGPTPALAVRLIPQRGEPRWKRRVHTHRCRGETCARCGMWLEVRAVWWCTSVSEGEECAEGGARLGRGPVRICRGPCAEQGRHSYRAPPPPSCVLLGMPLEESRLSCWLSAASAPCLEWPLLGCPAGRKEARKPWSPAPCQQPPPHPCVLQTLLLLSDGFCGM